MPIVIRIPTAEASEPSSTTVNPPRPTSANTAGLKAVTCANPADAYWMIQQAVLRRPDHLLRTQAPLSRAGGSRRISDSGAIAFRAGGATWHRRHLIAYGPMVKTCLDAAEAASEEGHDLEVIDLQRCRRWTWRWWTSRYRRPAERSRCTRLS